MTLARGTDRLQSDRLVLRRVTPDDLPFYTRLHAHPEVARNLYPEGRTRTPEETGAWMKYTLASYEQLALGYLAVVRKEDGALTFETELGYTFDPAVWGHGFATEAARCVRDYARDVLRLPYTVSAILPSNARSRRVAECGGAHAAGQMEVVGLTWDRYVWPLTTGARLRSTRHP